MRQVELNIIKEFLKSNKKLLYIFGDRGVGKSSLVNLFCQRFYNDINGDIVTVSALDYYRFPNLINSKKSKLLVIDDYLDATLINPILSPIPFDKVAFIDDVINGKKHDKIIIISTEPPSFFTSNLAEITQELNLIPPSKSDLINHLLAN